MMYPDGYNYSCYDCVINQGNGASYYGSRDGDGGVPYRNYIMWLDNYNNEAEVEELSAVRLLADCVPDINFYLAQLHLMVQRTTTLKETK